MKKVLVILLVVGLIFSLASMGIAQEKIRIGVLGKSVHPYWDVVKQGMPNSMAFLITGIIASGSEGANDIPSKPMAIHVSRVSICLEMSSVIGT